MKLGVIADVHGNDVALRAVLDDAAGYHVDRWWVLGDLVLFGPRPAEALDRLRGLPGVSMLRGNTDRYVLTGEQPAPHATAADAVGRIDLVERYAAMAAWPTRPPNAACWPDAVPTWSSAATPTTRPTGWSPAFAPSTPAVPGCPGHPARPAGCSLPAAAPVT